MSIRRKSGVNYRVIECNDIVPIAPISDSSIGTPDARFADVYVTNLRASNLFVDSKVSYPGLDISNGTQADRGRIHLAVPAGTWEPYRIVLPSARPIAGQVMMAVSVDSASGTVQCAWETPQASSTGTGDRLYLTGTFQANNDVVDAATITFTGVGPAVLTIKAAAMYGVDPSTAELQYSTHVVLVSANGVSVSEHSATLSNNAWTLVGSTNGPILHIQHQNQAVSSADYSLELRLNPIGLTGTYTVT